MRAAVAQAVARARLARDRVRMRANLELKARCADLDAARARATQLATAWLGVDEQVDTYFVTKTGRLKLRESRRSGAQLIPYFRSDAPGAKRSDYQVIAVDDGVGLARMLGAMLGVHRVVRKRREIALYENVRIHLDRVAGLGTFVELEAVWDGTEAGRAEQERKVAFLRERLGLRDEDLVAGGYETLLGE
jgi:predicted adenylyl cyclase CyaB